VSTHKRIPKGNGLLPADLAKSISTTCYVLAALGLAGGIAAFMSDRVHFGFAYLVGFLFTMTITAGSLFFVVILHLSKSGWSVAPRRALEWLSQGTTALPALFIPLILLAPQVWSKWMAPEAGHDHVIAGKHGYLNTTFFFIRAAVFLSVWALLAFWFYKNSREQDQTGDRKLTGRSEAFAAPATFLMGLSITFAAFDWIMSLSPHWYSTIFGVYVFAGSVVATFAVLALIAIRYRAHNVAGDLLTVEHQHDIGKYLFGFVIFWAYIGFAQFMLIFYANIPEETVFYRIRWEGGWYVPSLVLLFGHFIIPFLMLISRTGKRSPTILSLAAILVLAMHFLDLYWMVMPNLMPNFAMSWIDFAAFLTPVGLALAWIAYRVLGDPAYPLKDPYTPEALKAENL